MKDYRGRKRRPRSGDERLLSLPSRRSIARLLAVAGVAAVGLLPLSVSANAQSAGTEGLEGAVLAEMGVEQPGSGVLSARDSGRTQVNVMKTSEDGDWTFGSAVIKAPNKKGYYPQGWLFVADSSGSESGEWDVSLEGSDDFADRTAEAPEDVVSQDESETFAAADSGQTLSARGTATGLMLPWKKGTAWKFTGGPHGFNTGYDRPYSSLDFAGRGSDQSVRASNGGRIYTMCGNNRGWIRIYHPNGLTTSYYHLERNIRPTDGAKITRGTAIGQTGNDVSCGGASYGRHVHYSLMSGTTYIPVDNRAIGGWTFQEGSAYQGYTERRGVRRYPGSAIKNLGSS